MTVSNQPTLVTAMMDVGRDRSAPEFRRQFHQYLSSLKRLAQLDLPMHIHAEPQWHARILQWRRGKPTWLHTLDAAVLRSTPGFEQIQRIRQSPAWLSQADWLATSPMAELELYTPLVISKMTWLAQAAETAVQQGHADARFFWIDAGIHMHLYPGEHGLVNEDFFRTLVRDKNKFQLLAKVYESNTEVHGFNREALARYCQTDFVDRCCKGGTFGGSAKSVLAVNKLYNALLEDTLNHNLLGLDETLLTILSYRHPDLIDVDLKSNTSVPALFSPRLPTLSLRRLRNPRPAISALRRRALTRWNTWRHQKAANKILHSPPIQSTKTPTDNFDLHILLCKRDVVNGLWTLNSFLHYSGCNPRLIIHDDGSLDTSHLNTLTRHFPQATIIPFRQAHDDMSQALRDLPSSYRYRISEYSWPAIKLIDFAHYSQERPLMVLDADVLFFKTPQEILDAIDRQQGFYMSDWQDAYTWPLSRWPAVLGAAGLPKVNVGLMYLPDGRLYDKHYVEQCLQAYYQRQPCPRANWLEQTVWAALFSRLGERMIRLPETYQISTERGLGPDTCSHHYVNDSRLSRLNLTGQGIPRLIQNGLLEQKLNAGLPS